MSGIYVLSDTLKGGNKLDKTSTPKGKDVSDSPENAVAVFAVMLSSFMNSNVDSKGQNSKAGQESEEKQSAGNPVQSVHPNGQGSMLGCGNFALSNLFQPMLQSDLPAGKEANSGNDVSQGKSAGNNPSLVMLNKISLASDEVLASTGMTPPKPQGDNPGITELDKYRQVIANLLVALSGEITDHSPMIGDTIRSERAGLKDLSQDMVKIIQGWMTLTDDVANNGQASNGNFTSGRTTVSEEGAKAHNERISLANSSLAAKALDLLEALSGKPGETRESTAPSPMGNPLNSDRRTKDLRQDIAKVVQGWMTLADDVAGSSGHKGIQRLIEVLTTGFGNANTELNAKASTLKAALNSILSPGTKDAKVPQGVNETLQAEGDYINSMSKGRSETFMNKPKGMGNDLEPAATTTKDTTVLTNVQQKSDGMSPQENKTSKIFQGNFREEVQRGDSAQSAELSGVKDVPNHNTSVSISPTSNQVSTNVADGKTVAIPVWEQISTVVREQVMDRRQALKELDIQLHPADLGKIQIGMRWENGQVHLVVQASEAATGQLLQNQLSDLRQTLTNQGVNCGMLQMGQGGERQQNHRGDEPLKTLNRSTHPNEDEDIIPVTNPLSTVQDGINRINVTA